MRIIISRIQAGFVAGRAVSRSAARVVRRRGNLLAFLLVLAMLATAASVTLPVTLWPRHVTFWRLPAAPPASVTELAAGLGIGGDVPVFCVASRRGAARCGVARLVAAGRLRFTPYASMDMPAGATPLLTSASFSLLWALADPLGRFKVREDAASLAEELMGQVHALTQTPVWQRDYRPPISRLLERIADQVWAAPQTRLAFDALLDALHPVLRESFADDLGPALAPHVNDAMWRIVRANGAQVFSLIGGWPLDLSPLEAVSDQAFADPAARAAVGRLVPRLMATPQAELLAEQAANRLAVVLRREPAVLDLLTRVATDPRLESPLSHVRNQSDALLRESAELLWGLGGSNSLNSLAGLVMRAALAGEAQPMILLVGHREELLLRSDLPNGALALVRERAS